jgi:hypothetical protein
MAGALEIDLLFSSGVDFLPFIAQNFVFEIP